MSVKEAQKQKQLFRFVMGKSSSIQKLKGNTIEGNSLVIISPVQVICVEQNVPLVSSEVGGEKKKKNCRSLDDDCTMLAVIKSRLLIHSYRFLTAKPRHWVTDRSMIRWRVIVILEQHNIPPSDKHSFIFSNWCSECNFRWSEGDLENLLTSCSMLSVMVL